MLVSEPPISSLPDPLHGCSVLSMFPRTFSDSKVAPNANDSDGIEYIHNYMKSMALRSPNKLFEKAKSILHGDSELMNSTFASFHENNEEAAVAKGKGNPKERRPALGRKRARFSLHPNTSQLSVSLEPSFDIDQLHDPEEFFLAFEKHEYAKKEIQRQTGGSMTERDYNTSAIPRRRRPGILGKSFSHKHHYSSVISEKDGTLISSQETLDNDGPSNSISQEGTANPNVESQEKESDESISATENKVNDLLDDLLSREIDIFDGDGALSILQERLQINPVDLDKYLQEFSDIKRTDFVTIEERLPKSKKKLSDIQDLVKELSGKTPVKHKQVAENPVHMLASPTPPKSPFASLSLLKKRISQSLPYSDPFSANNDIGLSPARSSYSIEGSSRLLEQLEVGEELNISGKLKSPVSNVATNTTVASAGSKKVIPGESAILFDKSVNDNPSSTNIDIRSSEFHGDLVDHNDSNHMDDSARTHGDTSILTYGINRMAENAGDTLQEAVSSAQPDINVDDSTRAYTDNLNHTHGLNDKEGNVEDMPQEAAYFAQSEANFDESTTVSLKNNPSQLGQSNSTIPEEHFMEGPSTTRESGQELQNKELPKNSLKERSKTRRPRIRLESKPLSRRQSLAAAGTSWESGVRRSNRIKTRPLEYWKGERFLYGRVHQSLTTVIGLKYMSPAKGDGKPTFKVRSYVSDEHKELVELAALH